MALLNQMVYPIKDIRHAMLFLSIPITWNGQCQYHHHASILKWNMVPSPSIPHGVVLWSHFLSIYQAIYSSIKHALWLFSISISTVIFFPVLFPLHSSYSSLVCFDLLNKTSKPKSQCKREIMKTCVICFDQFGDEALLKPVLCTHYCCRSCLARYIIASQESPKYNHAIISCPVPVCSQGFDLKTVYRVLNLQQGRDWWHNAIEKKITNTSVSFLICIWYDILQWLKMTYVLIVGVLPLSKLQKCLWALFYTMFMVCYFVSLHFPLDPQQEQKLCTMLLVSPWYLCEMCWSMAFGWWVINVTV